MGNLTSEKILKERSRGGLIRGKRQLWKRTKLKGEVETILWGRTLDLNAQE